MNPLCGYGYGLDRRSDWAVFSAMDRAILEQHLAEAESHVLEGQKHIARQREIVAELEKDGWGLKDLETAKTLLAELEAMQVTHIADRDRIRAKLADLK